SSAGVLHVVAAENFWGSIAAQIGGARVEVVSIIDSPDADPHDYEPTAADARTVDQADIAIGNGIGYDPWFGKLVSSDPDGPIQVDVGVVAGLSTGANPHQWYSPTTVDRVIAAIANALAKAAPAQGDSFRSGKQRFELITLLNYHSVIDAIKTRYADVAVGASESIFAPLAPALGLRLITPPDFLAAVSEGTDPSATDKAAVDAQIEQHQIKVWLYNSQNATPDVARLNAAAKAAGIPIVTVTETMTPAGATFQDWQTAQLTRLQAALAQAIK
ncbi:MAG: putative cation transporter, periplasmic cation-binding protein, partial [Pseudonocardiales bacterium]|nr:putative cation transporter, periplasmic cation-binding protein [Pseudonocardiales bacterium]